VLIAYHLTFKPIKFVHWSDVSEDTNKGEEGWEGRGRCRSSAQQNLYIKVRVHIYAWTGRGVFRLAPPEEDATRPSHLAPTCLVSSRPVAARRDEIGRVGGTRPDVARPCRRLHVYASLSKDLAPTLYRVLAASVWSNYCSTINTATESQVAV